MKTFASSQALAAAVWGAAAGGAALSACSLGLGSEDSYFSAIGAHDAAGNGDDARPTSDDAETSDAGGGKDASMGTDTEASEPGPDAIAPGQDARADGAPADAALDVALPPAVLQVYYSFDDQLDAGSTQVIDHSTFHLDGELRGDTVPLIDPLGHVGHALALDGSQHQYVSLPAGVVAAFQSVSVACWINLKTSAIWDRLFDFNAGSSVWMYFSPTGWNPTTMQPGTHFAITTGPHLDPEMVLDTTLEVGAWHHVAIVLSAPYLIYYLDGVEKSRLTNMTLGPKDLGSTPQNWIGRSSYSTDPYLSASVDEFRVYSGALSPHEVMQLAQ